MARLHASLQLEPGAEATGQPLTVWADYLQYRTWQERRVDVYASTASTQDRARELAATLGGDADRALVVAGDQTQGRGRLGRAWITPPGSAVTLSYLCRLTDATVDRLTFATAVALARSLDTILEPLKHHTHIKWPNDLYVGSKKIAGILVETANDTAVIGVGVNVEFTLEQLPAELRDSVTSLGLLGCKVDRLRVLADAVIEMDRALYHADKTELLDEWRRRCLKMHQPITLRHGDRVIAGRLIDLDPDAGLVVKQDSGEIVRLPAATTTVL